jgi:hypothetical protein
LDLAIFGPLEQEREQTSAPRQTATPGKTKNISSYYPPIHYLYISISTAYGPSWLLIGAVFPFLTPTDPSTIKKAALYDRNLISGGSAVFSKDEDPWLSVPSSLMVWLFK